MSIKIGINGFGRIGRLVFRASLSNPNIEVVAINDLVEVDYLAYLLKYDSTHPTLKFDISTENNTLIVNGSRINVSSESDISKINWKANGVEFVVVVAIKYFKTFVLKLVIISNEDSV